MYYLYFRIKYTTKQNSQKQIGDIMTTLSTKLNNAQGLHARPATEIAKNANQYTCDIKFAVQGKEYNAKSVLNIMSAGIKNNTQIKIICDGIDEEKALSKMIEKFENL